MRSLSVAETRKLVDFSDTLPLGLGTVWINHDISEVQLMTPFLWLILFCRVSCRPKHTFTSAFHKQPVETAIMPSNNEAAPGAYFHLPEGLDCVPVQGSFLYPTGTLPPPHRYPVQLNQGSWSGRWVSFSDPRWGWYFFRKTASTIQTYLSSIINNTHRWNLLLIPNVKHCWHILFIGILLELIFHKYSTYTHSLWKKIMILRLNNRKYVRNNAVDRSRTDRQGHTLTYSYTV